MYICILNIFGINCNIFIISKIIFNYLYYIICHLIVVTYCVHKCVDVLFVLFCFVIYFTTTIQILIRINYSINMNDLILSCRVEAHNYTSMQHE